MAARRPPPSPALYGCSRLAAASSRGQFDTRVAPKAHTSDRLSTSFPRACSGDMEAAVPRIRPASVLPRASVGDGETLDGDDDAVASSPVQALARPKSSTLTLPSGGTSPVGGRWSRKNAHIRLVASMLRLPGPAPPPRRRRPP